MTAHVAKKKIRIMVKVSMAFKRIMEVYMVVTLLAMEVSTIEVKVKLAVLLLLTSFVKFVLH